MKSVLRELRVHESTLNISAVLARISLAKNRMETPQDALVSAVFERYQKQSARSRTLDFDHLLLESVRLLKRQAKGLEVLPEAVPLRAGRRIPGHQRPPYAIVTPSPPLTELCVVGDDDQSIYGCAAPTSDILGLHRDFKGAKVVRLETNYRSTQPILDAANAVIRQIPPREIARFRGRRGRAGPSHAPSR